MPQPSKYLAVPGDECQCGRRATIRHCTACGSTRVYARLNRLHKMINGTSKYVETEYRCQACGHLFIDEERAFCDAPPTTASLAAQKLAAIRDADARGEHLNGNDAKIAEALRESLPQTVEDKDNARKILIMQLRNAYADELVALANKKGVTYQQLKESGEIKESMDEYVARRLPEFEVSK